MHTTLFVHLSVHMSAGSSYAGRRLAAYICSSRGTWSAGSSYAGRRLAAYISSSRGAWSMSWWIPDIRDDDMLQNRGPSYKLITLFWPILISILPIRTTSLRSPVKKINVLLQSDSTGEKSAWCSSFSTNIAKCLRLENLSVFFHTYTHPLVPGVPVVAKLEIMQFLNGYGYLLLSHSPWEWGSLSVGISHNITEHPFTSPLLTLVMQ